MRFAIRYPWSVFCTGTLFLVLAYLISTIHNGPYFQLTPRARGTLWGVFLITRTGPLITFVLVISFILACLRLMRKSIDRAPSTTKNNDLRLSAILLLLSSLCMFITGLLSPITPLRQLDTLQLKSDRYVLAEKNNMEYGTYYYILRCDRLFITCEINNIFSGDLQPSWPPHPH